MAWAWIPIQYNYLLSWNEIIMTHTSKHSNVNVQSFKQNLTGLMFFFKKIFDLGQFQSEVAKIFPCFRENEMFVKFKVTQIQEISTL